MINFRSQGLWSHIRDTIQVCNIGHSLICVIRFVIVLLNIHTENSQIDICVITLEHHHSFRLIRQLLWIASACSKARREPWFTFMLTTDRIMMLSALAHLQGQNFGLHSLLQPFSSNHCIHFFNEITHFTLWQLLGTRRTIAMK